MDPHQRFSTGGSPPKNGPESSFDWAQQLVSSFPSFFFFFFKHTFYKTYILKYFFKIVFSRVAPCLQIQNGGTPELPSTGIIPGPDSVGYPYSNQSIMSE